MSYDLLHDLSLSIISVELESRCKTKKKKWNVWDTIIFALSIYVLLQLATEVIVIFPSSLLEVFTAIDFGICIIFLADWVYFFYKS